MKTPEEMAEEYGAHIDLCCGTSDIIIAAEKGFFAGYQAAKDEDEAKMQELKANWKFCCEDKARLLNELAVAERAKDQLAAADKVMPQWISVNERLPPDGAKVLLIVFGDIHYGWIDQSPSDPTEYCLYFSNTYIDKGHHALTHWMPIPRKPKYMSDYVEYERPKEEK